MNKEWFVLHTLVGQEKKAQKLMNARIVKEGMQEFVGQILIPEQKVTENKNGKKRTLTKRIFPGYLLAELALYDENAPRDARGLPVFHDQVWQFVRGTTGVIGFVGVNNSDPNARPKPLTSSEVEAILSNKPVAEQRPVVKFDFAVNDTVKMKDGPFMGLTGSVCMVDPDKGKLKVEVAIFNRNVQVDAEAWQVEKVEPEKVDEAPVEL